MSGGARLRHELDAALHLLDRQLVDVDGEPVGKVDDLELTEQADGAPFVSAILSGPGALGPRFGRWGRWLAPTHRLNFSLVRKVGTCVELVASADDLATRDAERWTGQHVIGHIPGSRHASA
jgi:hypothetical protein